MKYLLIMSLSGSTMVGIYILLRCLLRNWMPARLQYLLLKAAALYYLVPLPFLKGWYTALAKYMRPEGASVSRASAAWAGCMVHANEKIYINVYLKAQMVVVTLWLLFAVMWLTYELNDYCKTRKRVLACADHVLTKEESDWLEQLKERCGVRRHVTVYQDDAGEKTLTFGFFQPIILCDQKPGSPDAELLLCHELIHIKRWDVWWKMLMQCVILLHWWNPAAWILYRNYDLASEWSCDEAVVQDRTKYEVKRYLRLLILESIKEEESDKPYRRWVTGFGTGAKQLKKRMDNVMRTKKWNKAAAGALVAALVLVNSLTVFAYEDTIHVEPKEDVSQDDVDYFVDGEAWQFISYDIGEEARKDTDEYSLYTNEIKFDRQFVDAEGNIYEVSDEDTAEVYRGCNHSYEAGEETIHNKQSGGGCIVRVYEAERCRKCGWILLGDFISETRYAVCPHP